MWSFYLVSCSRSGTRSEFVIFRNDAKCTNHYIYREKTGPDKISPHTTSTDHYGLSPPLQRRIAGRAGLNIQDIALSQTLTHILIGDYSSVREHILEVNPGFHRRALICQTPTFVGGKHDIYINFCALASNSIREFRLKNHAAGPKLRNRLEWLGIIARIDAKFFLSFQSL